MLVSAVNFTSSLCMFGSYIIFIPHGFVDRLSYHHINIMEKRALSAGDLFAFSLPDQVELAIP